MSYVITPSSDGGSGVQNPMTANLDAGGFNITSVNELTGASAVSANFLIAGLEIAHTNPGGTIGFYGVPPVPQAPPMGPFVGADPVQNEQAINDLIMILQNLGLIA